MIRVFFSQKSDHTGVCFTQSGEDGVILHPILMLCCMAAGGRLRAITSIFLTGPAEVDQERETVHPHSLVLLRERTFVFGKSFIP